MFNFGPPMRRYNQYHIISLSIFFFIIAFYFLTPSSHSEMVLVTGGLGFIGSNLVDELLVAGYDVIIFDDESSGHNHNSKAYTIFGDITIKQDFRQIRPKIDYIVHLAAAISVEESMKNPKKYEDINLHGSRNVLEWAVEHKVKKVISASSAAVYGTPKILPVGEATKPNPISPYARTKLDMEYIHEEMNDKHGIDTICLRFFNVFGPRQDPKSGYSGVISKFIDNAMEGTDITIYGDGKNTRDFIFVKDIARAIMQAMKYGEGFQVFNVGTETITTITQLAQTIIRVTESDIDIKYKPARDGDIKDSLSNTSNIQNELRWIPQYTLEQGLRRTISWYKSEVLKLH